MSVPSERAHRWLVLAAVVFWAVSCLCPVATQAAKIACFLSVNPSGEQVAFSYGNSAAMDVSAQMLVLDIRSCRYVFMSAEGWGLAQRSCRPWGWFPDGALLWTIRETPPAGTGAAECEMLLFEERPTGSGSLGPGWGGRPLGATRYAVRRGVGAGVREPGLCLADRADTEGSLSLLLSDGWTPLGRISDRVWLDVLWAQDDDAGLRLVAAALEGHVPENPVSTFWAVACGHDGTIAERKLVATFPEDVVSTHVDPNGIWLAAVVRTRENGRSRVVVTPIRETAAGVTTFDISSGPTGVVFHPTDGSLLIWASSSASGQGPHLYVVPPPAIGQEERDSLAGWPKPREVPIPAGIEDIAEAAYLDAHQIILSVPDVGLLVLNTDTGAISELWRFPEGPLPYRPHIELLPLETMGPEN